MKYKLLINARKATMLKDIFIHAGIRFECLSTSDCWEDIRAHLELFCPDVYIYFSDEASGDIIKQLNSVKKNPEYSQVTVVVVGSEEFCEDIERNDPESADLIIKRPITTEKLLQKITLYLENKKLEEEEQKKAAAAVYTEPEPDLFEMPKSGKKHVLIIDDDRNILKMLKSALEERYDVTVMASGKMARKYLETRTADLILLDYEMPGESGPEVLIKIRADSRLIGIPVVFLTGISDKEKIKSVIMLNPQGYLLKPIDMKRLFKTIEDIIG